MSGSEFAAEPAVTIGGTEVEVIRSREDKILVRVPEDAAAGTATVDVDGATADLEILAAGAPVVLHQSATTATAGQTIILVGRRLNGATVDILSADVSVATMDLKGRRRVAYFVVPDDLAPGDYTLVLTGVADADAPAPESCPLDLTVVAAGNPTITSADPSDQTPGRGIRFKGTDLGPLGHCRVTWKDAQGKVTKRHGIANGFDTVWSRVPVNAAPGATYDIVITFKDGGSTAEGGEFSYTVGDFPDPVINSIDPTAGPAGDLVDIKGTGLFAGFVVPTVEFTRDGVATEAKVVSGYGAFRGEDETLIVLVPATLEDGDYDVTVTAGDATSNAVVFTVTTLPLAVTSMKPTSQGLRGPRRPVVIEGSGFGPVSEVSVTGQGRSRSIDWKLAVTWDDGGDGPPLMGHILYKTDSQIVVIPPGAWFDPLPAGTYTVRVVKNPGTDAEESVAAGTYTVE